MSDTRSDSVAEARWKMANLKIDCFVKLASFIGVFVAAAVAFFNIRAQQVQFQEAEKHRIDLDLKIVSEPIETNEERAVLLVTVELANTGFDTIRPYSHKEDPHPSNPEYSGEGCTLSLTEHELPSVVPRFNILEKYDYGTPGSWSDRYKIRPKTTYRETEAIAVKRGLLYEVTVRFYGKGLGTITENQFFYVK